jgi:uncharacterized membrane protein (GlpM family)
VSDVATLALKGCVGGLFVVAFALLSECLRPKTFAGLFGAAPSIALAALAVTVTTKGSDAASAQLLGMIGGALALVVYCACASIAVDRWRALRGSLVAFTVWFGVAGLYAWALWAG